MFRYISLFQTGIRQNAGFYMPKMKKAPDLSSATEISIQSINIKNAKKIYFPSFLSNGYPDKLE